MTDVHTACEAKLASLSQEIDHTSKMLVRRDIALMSANTRLEELDHAKSEFVSIAAHQLRTPLTSIKWFSEMLMSDAAQALNPQQKKNLSNIIDASAHMGDLISALLSVSRLELGTLDQYIEEIDLPTLITKVASDLEGIRIKNDVRKIITLQSAQMPLQTDRQLLEMILHNLISNAYKYTPSGGSVTIGARATAQDTITLTVTDTGYGIPKAEQKKVFTKFYRASNIRDGADGTGLGLHIIQMATKKLRGTLEMDSVEGKGTTFRVILPRMKVQHQALQPVVTP